MNTTLPGWTEALGWTLLNSVWQALVVAAILIIVLRVIPLSNARLRYILACLSMIMLIAAASATFIYLTSGHNAPAGAALAVRYTTLSLQSIDPSPPRDWHSAVSRVLTSVDANMPLIIAGWMIGAVLFSLRMVSGWWYISKLRAEATVLENHWSDQLAQIARQLRIHRVITLAESARIHAPVVIGFMKPVILVPVGMFSGLTAEQVETIFIHELAHIRRHDFLVNIAQSIVEAVFFFNPFVWLMSGIIRREREFCCDDEVLGSEERRLSYARALTRLEEQRLERSVFALSLAENKKLLLNRIKRIMEKSARNYSGKDLIIPAVLLVVGLVCASWLTIDSKGRNEQKVDGGKTQAADTLKKDQKSATYSKKIITSYDEQGNPHEEITENFSGDESLKPLVMAPGFENFSQMFDLQGAPDFPDMPGAPDVFNLQQLMPPLDVIDTIPPGLFRYRQNGDWEEFSKEFEAKFREKFGEFFKENEKDFDKLMKEMEEKFAQEFDHHDWDIMQEFDVPMQELEHLREELDAMAGKHFSFEDMRANEEIMAQMEKFRFDDKEWAEKHQKAFEEMESQMRNQELHFREMEAEMRAFETKMKEFEKELVPELVKDGYLKNGDNKIESMNWDDDGKIEINGREIKPEHRDKYRKLHRKYFKEQGSWRYIE